MKTKGKVRVKGRRDRNRKGAVPSRPAARKSAKPVALPPRRPASAAPAHAKFAKPAPPDKQHVLYGEAIRLFYSHKFDKAVTLFQKVAQGPDRTLAHHAQTHVKICQARLKQPAVQLRTADDHYAYATTMMNTQRPGEAARHLETALRLQPRAEHLHYAMAAAQAQLGNSEGAYQRLKTAIELEPRNRARARADADFAAVFDHPPVASLLHLDRRSG